MRITGGKVRGTRLKTLQARSVRPTTGVVKRAIFSMLENSATDWRRVLDLYAGSGALGLEALSRGAEWVDFVEHRKPCCDVIRSNLQRTGQLHRAHVYCCTVSKAVGFLDDSYDIVLMDPPYSDLSTGHLLETIGRSRLLEQGSIVVVCHANRSPLKIKYEGLHPVKQRRYGDSSISIYQKEA